MLPDGFLAFINEHRLFAHTDRLLLAVSGGVDSMVLAALVKQEGFDFGIAHVNFGLRGTDSDDDAAFVENIALSYGVPFHLTRFNTAAEAQKRGESTQVTARQLRYEWFRQLQTEHGYAAVATAHHLNDVLETMLLNLTRGTGLAGLRGMPVQSELTATWPRLVRPLWFTSRAAIDAYARQQSILWREDSSNASDAYSRNQIRHHVVPVLEQINPGVLQTIPRTIGQLRAAEVILQHELTASFQQCTQPADDGFIIDIAALNRYPEPLFRLGEWLRPYGFTTDVLTQCWQAVNPTGSNVPKQSQVFLASDYRLIHEQGKLSLLPHQLGIDLPVQLNTWPDKPIDLGKDGQLVVELVGMNEWDGTWPSEPTIALLDAGTLPFPWQLRHWRQGDRFKPLGMNGSRLVSDFLADGKLSRRQRERVWVLECAGQILCILGLRVSQLARLTNTTRQLAILRWQHKSGTR
ncbi:tRNA lysidine(34) synthetase TilS [Fibrella forsythiae]|uniref:tRNA(Ile)-lysidine synthase n=1 Tax=Fibrella forsythiae TaxID=2817061 RepID=A0ABS3JGH3_9BACT|nr:tRNA lysidine(34) synthetase TilS [Fibrella forsythiae]MBO0949087.1 tRNA lysidine(34) synthetase TilS [Fibrella forsythiae]